MAVRPVALARRGRDTVGDLPQMGRPPKEFDDDAILEVINRYRDMAEEGTRLPSTSEVASGYESETGEDVNRKTLRQYLKRTDMFERVRVGDYFGWRAS